MRNRSLLIALALFLSVQDPNILLAQSSSETDAETKPSSRLSVESGQGEACDMTSDDALVVKPGAYGQCTIKAKNILFEGAGDFDLQGAKITAEERVVFVSPGIFDLSVAEVQGDIVVFTEGSLFTGPGAKISSNTICGSLKQAEMTGATFTAKNQISLDLISSDVRQSTFQASTFGPGTIDRTELAFTVVIDCETNLADFSKAIGRPQGNCPVPEKGDPTIACHY